TSRADQVLVKLTGFETRNESFPDARCSQPAHGILRRIPTIEVPDDADAIRGRRPDGERNSALAVVCDRVRAEFVVDTQMLAFAEEMEIEIAEGRRKFASAV